MTSQVCVLLWLTNPFLPGDFRPSTHCSSMATDLWAVSISSPLTGLWYNCGNYDSRDHNYWFPRVSDFSQENKQMRRSMYVQRQMNVGCFRITPGLFASHFCLRTILKVGRCDSANGRGANIPRHRCESSAFSYLSCVSPRSRQLSPVDATKVTQIISRQAIEWFSS